MRLVSFDLGSDPIVAGGAVNARVEDIKLAAALLAAATSAAEQELAGSAFAGRAAARKIIRACASFEAAVSGKG
jgi:hypothetical protein